MKKRGLKINNRKLSGKLDKTICFINIILFFAIMAFLCFYKDYSFMWNLWLTNQLYFLSIPLLFLLIIQIKMWCILFKYHKIESDSSNLIYLFGGKRVVCYTCQVNGTVWQRSNATTLLMTGPYRLIWHISLSFSLSKSKAKRIVQMTLLIGLCQSVRHGCLHWHIKSSINIYLFKK